KSGKAEAIFFDDDLPGHGIRLRAGGSCTWVFQYKLGTKHRRMSLGKFPAISAVAARKTAGQLHAEGRLGNDPAFAKASKQAKASETFGAVLKIYLARRRRQVRASTYKENERHLDRNLRALHELPLVQVDQRTIAGQLSRLTDQTGPTQANRTRASLTKFL